MRLWWVDDGKRVELAIAFLVVFPNDVVKVPGVKLLPATSSY